MTSATLEIEVENYYGNGTGHTINLFDVSSTTVPDLDTNNGSGNGVAIYNDIGTGTSYGSQGGLTAANVGDILSFTLPASALTDIEAAAGNDFAVGGLLTTTNPGNFWGLRFSGGNEARVHRLTINTCAIEPDLTATKTVEIYDPGNLGKYGLPGEDVIYSINVVNEGNAPVIGDSILLIDRIPANTIFYHDDVANGGPGTDPVVFIDNGSGLNFDYATDVGYSIGTSVPTDFATECSYTPTVSGYAPEVTFICIKPTGTMANGSPFPEFTVQFRVQIQ